MNCEEVTQTILKDNEFIENSVKRALECLNISSNERQMTRMTDQESDQLTDQLLNNNCQIENNTSFASTTDNTENSETMVELNADTTDSISTTSADNNKKIKIEMNDNRDEDIEEKSDCTDICEIRESTTEWGEVSNSECSYMNAILNKTFGKPVANRYPLKYRWQLWFWRADQGVKVVWHKALQQVCKPFDTIEGFWRLYHHIVCVQHLVPPSDYCVFKEGIKPMWEDINNINGGKWILEFAKGPNRECNPILDEIWLEVLLCLIGEGFNEYGEEICGAVVNIRSKEDRITVWTANANKSVANLKIGEILKIRTGYGGKLKYEANSTSQRIAEAKDKLMTTRIKSSYQRVKPTRRSCVF